MVDFEIMKAFCIKDGYAIHDLLPAHGIVPILITGRESVIVENRARELGVELVFQGVKDKLALLKKIATENVLTLDEIAYIGDDLNDLECMNACGLSGCPADAVESVKEKVDFVSRYSGGSGAVRDFIEYVSMNCK